MCRVKDCYKTFQYADSQEQGLSWVQSESVDEDLRPSPGHADLGIVAEPL